MSLTIDNSGTPTSVSPPDPQSVIVEMRGISKRFPGVQALEGASLSLRRGEVHAIVGENGAGKSTLMKVLAGVYRPDSGEVLLRGQAVSFHGPSEAIHAGISTIHQELNLIPNITVAENIMLTREPVRWRLLDERALNDGVAQSLRDLEIDLEPRAIVEDLTMAKRQMVEIARAVMLEADVVIMDEPTSSITERETEVLFALIARLKSKGVAILYISHRMEEIFSLADRVTVLRDGQLVATKDIAEVTPGHLISMMVGRELTNLYPEKRGTIGDVLLDVRDLQLKGSNHKVSFTLHAGEILGFAGLVGAGRTEIMRAIFGADPMVGGEVLLEGSPVRATSPNAAIRRGIAFVTEDRKLQGLVLGMSVRENASMVTLPGMTRSGFIDAAAEMRLARTSISRFGIRTPGTEQEVVNLSGGNQQKVVLAKWLAVTPKLLILDEPTRGIDVAAKAEIHALIAALAAEGLGILLISSELPEVLGMSDRVLVMREGQIVGEFARAEATQEAIMGLAA
jgi:ABC-type sugar transport system ATPase subunit